MKYRFGGTLQNDGLQGIRFEIAEGRIYFPLTSVLAFSSSEFEDSLYGLTDDGQSIVITVDHLRVTDVGQGLYIKQGSINGRCFVGFVNACMIFDGSEPAAVDSIGFYSCDIPNITGRHISGRFNETSAKLIGLEEALGVYERKGHKYQMSVGYLLKEPYYRKQILEIKADHDFSTEMLIDSYFVTRRLLSFLYQKNLVPIEGVYLRNKGRNIGRLFVDQIDETCKDALPTSCISISQLGNRFGSLLQAIADGKIYLRHLPVFKEEERLVTPGRLLMALVGLERLLSFFGCYGATDKKTQAIISSEGNLRSLVANSTGEEKKIYKGFLNKLKHYDGLRQRIALALHDNRAEIENFYPMAFVEWDMNELAQELSSIRNNLAHGDYNVGLTPKNAEQIVFLTLLILYFQLLLVGFNKEEASRIVPTVVFPSI